jgi:hypothetical protein
MTAITYSSQRKDSAESAASEFRRLAAVFRQSVRSVQKPVPAELQRLRDEVEACIMRAVDGDLSAEQSWREVCDIVCKTDDLPTDVSSIRAFFDGHIETLSEMMRDEMWFVELAHTDFARIYGISIESMINDLADAIERTQHYRHQILERWPLTKQEFAYAFPVDVEEVVYISPGAFLRSMAMTIWSAFRHPFSTTYIDLSTGECVTLAK